MAEEPNGPVTQYTWAVEVELSARRFSSVCLLAIACSPSPRVIVADEPLRVLSSRRTAEGDTGAPNTKVATPTCQNCGAAAVLAFPKKHPNAVDLESWLRMHEVAVRDPQLESLESYVCDPVVIGKPPRDGLLCLDGSPDVSLQGGVSTFVAIIVVADRGRLRTALRVPFAAGPADLEGDMTHEEADYIRLDVEIKSGENSVTIADRLEARCAQRIKDAADNGPFLKVIKIACSSRGRYVWTSGRFVRIGRRP